MHISNTFWYLWISSKFISSMIFIYKVRSTRSCSGISLKTQILSLIAYVFRYDYKPFFKTDLFGKTIMLLNFALILYQIYLIVVEYGSSYQKRHDTFRIEFIIALALVLTVLIDRNKSRNLSTKLDHFSRWVEALSSLPQIIMMERTNNFTVLSMRYVFFLGIYYIFDWIVEIIVFRNTRLLSYWISGSVQIVIYSDFIYTFISSYFNKNPQLEVKSADV